MKINETNLLGRAQLGVLSFEKGKTFFSPLHIVSFAAKKA